MYVECVCYVWCMWFVECVTCIHRLIQRDHIERQNYVQAAVRWSRQVDKSSSSAPQTASTTPAAASNITNTGHPLLHGQFALTYWQGIISISGHRAGTSIRKRTQFISWLDVTKGNQTGLCSFCIVLVFCWLCFVIFTSPLWLCFSHFFVLGCSGLVARVVLMGLRDIKPYVS